MKWSEVKYWLFSSFNFIDGMVTFLLSPLIRWSVFRYASNLPRNATHLKTTAWEASMHLVMCGCISLLIYALFLLALDRDECQNDQSNDCDQNAVCNNTVGSFECSCQKGYTGNGKNCSGKYWCVTLYWLGENVFLATYSVLLSPMMFPNLITVDCGPVVSFVMFELVYCVKLRLVNLASPFKLWEIIAWNVLNY